jgi:hypothetical protein
MGQRYKLSDEKTFESLFFPEKPKLLSLLEHFQNKDGEAKRPGQSFSWHSPVSLLLN